MPFTRYSEITVKDLQVLQGIDVYKRAWCALRAIKNNLQVDAVLVLHLAQHWKCDEAEILTALK